MEPVKAAQDSDVPMGECRLSSFLICHDFCAQNLEIRTVCAASLCGTLQRAMREHGSSCPLRGLVPKTRKNRQTPLRSGQMRGTQRSPQDLCEVSDETLEDSFLCVNAALGISRARLSIQGANPQNEGDSDLTDLLSAIVDLEHLLLVAEYPQ